MQVDNILSKTGKAILELHKDICSMAIIDLPAPFRQVHLLERGADSFLSFHSHDFYHVNYITSGSVSVTINNHTYHIHAGQVFVLPPVIPHELYSPKGYSQFGLDILIQKDERGIFELFSKAFPDGFGIVTLTGISINFEQTYRSLHNISMLNILKITNTAEHLVLSAIEQSKLNVNSSFRDVFLQTIESKNHFLLPLEEICILMKMSKTHLERLVKSEFGCGVIEYCNKLRLVHACLLLQSTDFPIKYISEQLAFCDESHFSSFFKKRMAVTPKQYRNSSRYQTML